MRRWLIRILSVSLSLLAILFIAGFFLMPDGASEVLQRVTAQNIRYQQIKVLNQDSLVVGAYAFGEPVKPALLLIHGSPGDWSAWENVISSTAILDNYFIIVMDRPGYGLTSIQAKPDLSSQARAAWSLIDYLELDSITVAGHSYGGAVVAQLLVDHDDKFQHGFIVAGTISPQHMQPRWYNKLADWSLVKMILPKDLLASNIEMVGLPSSLEALEAELPEVRTPITVMQGTEDVLVPFESIDYFRQVKPEGVNYIILDGKNHFIPWTEPELINEVLINLVDHEN